MAKTIITQEFVKKLTPPISKAKEVYYDTQLKGFILENRSTGTQTLYYQTTIQGKRKMIKLGDTIELTIEEARAKCIELKKHNHQLITQPQEPQINPITFQQFYDNHYLPYIHTHIKSYETNISVFKNHILSHLANTPMKDLKKNQVMQYHSSMVKDKNLAPATANKFLIFLSNAYKLSHDFELLPHDINPCRGIKEFELNNQRQIFLTNTQAKRLLSK